jgi:hypothetical protein
MAVLLTRVRHQNNRSELSLEYRMSNMESGGDNDWTREEGSHESWKCLSESGAVMDKRAAGKHKGVLFASPKKPIKTELRV